jgi:hypothetical protein
LIERSGKKDIMMLRNIIIHAWAEICQNGDLEKTRKRHYQRLKIKN